MKISENWLRSFVNPEITSEELAHLLTMAGIEVESVEAVASAFDQVVVAEVLSVEKHPDADRLRICTVMSGSSDNDVLQIVCGAPNVRAGIKVPCALIGANLSGLTIKQTKLRGVESSGMLCSAKELGIGEAAEGLLLLPSDAPIGMDFRSYYGLDDRIFTLSLTPNRADCLGIWGVAREVAALTAAQLHIPEIKSVVAEIDDSLPIHVAAEDASPLYCSRIIRGVNVSMPSPLWLVQRLERSGIRAINPIVDITNYVLLETGQPMHAFDLGKIEGNVTVRYAVSGEKIILLNGDQIELNSTMLLIADSCKPLALAGIMGGLESGVTQNTTDIFLESAFFNPKVISGKSFQLGFSSDSAYRFERGVDFEATRYVLELATNLIRMICDGKAGPVSEVKHQLPQRNRVKVRCNRVKRILGVDIDKQMISEYFKRLGFAFTLQEDDIFYVSPPSYRYDLAIEEDFIEELARIYGYDQIPPHHPYTGMVMLPVSEKETPVSRIKQSLIARDYQEVINYAFVDAAWELDFANNSNPIALKNPIANQMSVMRSTLIGGLIANLQFNLNRKQPRVRLFETGCCFMQEEADDYRQIDKISGLCYGDVMSEQWGMAARPVDFYDVKADVEILCGKKEIYFEKFLHPALHPGKSARILSAGKMIGWLGELHPNWQKKYEIQRNTVLFELELSHLTTVAIPIAKEISKFPPVRRDIAIVVSNEISVHTLLACMNKVKPPIVADIYLFDIYRGKGMEATMKSLAFRFLLQDNEKTLTDEEADLVVTNVIKILNDEFGATLRN